MTTTVKWGGAATYGGPATSVGEQTKTINHPSELRGLYPRAPLQPIADWPTILAEFETLMNAGAYESIMDFGVKNYVSIRIADVPSGARTGLKNWISYNREGKSIPTCMVGPISDWVNSGSVVSRAAFD